MESIDFGTLFQGFGTMIAKRMVSGQCPYVLIALGFLLII